MHERFFLLLFVFFLTTGCISAFIPCEYSLSISNAIADSSERLPQSFLAKVGDIEITKEEFISSYEFGPAFIKQRANSKKRHLEYMIKEKLLALDACSRGLDTLDQANEMYSAIVDDLATEELFKEDILSKIKINKEEIDTLIGKKKIELELKWIFSAEEDAIINAMNSLQNGVPFDTLFLNQFNDTLIYRDERSLNISRHALEVRNPVLASIVDSLPVGEFSHPIFAGDGWYIIKVENVWMSMLTSEAEEVKLRTEAETALKKRKMDKLADEYVNELLFNQKPIIKRNVFNILRTYLANYVLPPEKYNEWNLKEKLEQALVAEGNPSNDEIGDLILVIYNEGKITLKEFLMWYRARDQYLKFNKGDLPSFSVSIENYIWQMFRDKLLSRTAQERGYYQAENVIKQALWWRDKIAYSMAKNELKNSIILKMDESPIDNNSEQSKSDYIRDELTKKLFYKTAELKQKYDIFINDEQLKNIKVSVEHDPTAVEFYMIKKGGLIPRTPFPTIDHDWSNWE
jgi:hypothetical protein